jgi:hypothetical protein
MTLEVRAIDEKTWGLFAGNRLIGQSKNRYDADFAREVLTQWKDGCTENRDDR